MKILVASHTYIVDLNREKLRALAQLQPDIEVMIVVPLRWQPGGVQADQIETEVLQEGAFRVVPVSNLSQNNQGLLTFGIDLVQLLLHFKPDIIQVEQGAKSLAYCQFITLNKVLGIQAKNLFFTWWNLPYELKWPISVLEAYNLRHTDGLVAGNQDAVKVLQARGYDGPFRVMPQLGVDERLFQRQPQPELRRQLGIQPDEFVMGFVGRFVREKGLLTLAKALGRLTDYPWKWLLVGRGELKQELKEMAGALGIADRLIWIESVPHDQVYRYINVMNTLVLPSESTQQFKTLTSVGWKEQFGHVLIEAMACKVSVIGSDCGEIPNVIEGAGLVFPEQNVEALKNCLEQLITQPLLVQELGQQGYHRVLECYTNKALARHLFNFYQELMEIDENRMTD